MGAQHTIVIPYSHVERIHPILLRLLAAPESRTARIELRRIVLPSECRAGLSELLFSEFRALQVLAQKQGRQIVIGLNRPVLAQ